MKNIRWTVLYQAGGFLHRVYDRVWDMSPASPDGLAYRLWNGALGLTEWAALTCDRMA